MKTPSPGVYRRLSRALAQVGIFAVGLPESSSEAVKVGLRSFAGCAGIGAAAGFLPVSQLVEGSERTSLALSVNASEQQPLPKEIVEHCPGFSATSGALRAVVDRAGVAAARLVDGLVLPGVNAGSEFDSFADAAAFAESLEHFHLYRPQKMVSPLFLY